MTKDRDQFLTVSTNIAGQPLYDAAYNAGIEAAAVACEEELWVEHPGDFSREDGNFAVRECIAAIRALKR